MYQICYYFLIFFIYSLMGWVVETINCSWIAKKKVLNRGFLIGPYLPIYGIAALLMTLFLTEYKSDPFVLFCMVVVYASLLEYFTSYWMEKVFHARWWNYTNEKLNLNGRICLKNSLLFGVLGFFVLYIINPGIFYLLDKIPRLVLEIVSLCFFVIFLIDAILTLWILSKLNIQIKNIHSDATEEIDREVKKLLAHYKILYKRLFRAYPKLHFNSERGNVLIDSIRQSFDDADKFLTKKKQEIAAIKTKIKTMKENSIEPEKIKEQKENLKEVRKRKFK